MTAGTIVAAVPSVVDWNPSYLLHHSVAAVSVVLMKWHWTAEEQKRRWSLLALLGCCCRSRLLRGLVRNREREMEYSEACEHWIDLDKVSTLPDL